MEFITIFNQVAILFVILLIGLVAGKYKIIDSTGTKKLSEVLLFVTSPMMVLNSFFIEFSKERIVNVLWIIGTGIGMFIISIFLSKVIYGKFEEKIVPVLRFTAIFSNCGYMGLPLLYAVFGSEGVFYGSFYIVTFHTVLWSYGYMMYGGKESKAKIIKRLLINPSIIALYIGLIIFLFSISVPETIMGAVRAVGDMTMPLSMLIIGGIMSSTKLLAVFSDWRVYLSSLIRLIVMPLLYFAITYLLGVPSLPIAVMVTLLAMPAAANTTIFAEMFDKDAVFASKCVTVSTILSIITAPIIISTFASL
ncbi:MAG: AEC family transporter [Clostridiaceae bacterium]|jgi:predicted permease|nr:AEC family transporter [Clostridiaceae bacterium]